MAHDHPAAEWDGKRPAWLIQDNKGRLVGIGDCRSEATEHVEHDLCPESAEGAHFEERPMSALGAYLCEACPYAPCVAREVFLEVKR